jgi:hypothetical protein
VYRCSLVNNDDTGTTGSTGPHEKLILGGELLRAPYGRMLGFVLKSSSVCNF